MRFGTPAVRGRSVGIALFSLGVLLFALNDALAKWLVADYGVGQILFLRSVGAAAVLVPIVWKQPSRPGASGRWDLHALRILCMAADTFCFYFATKALPLADVMTFYLAAPLIVTALAVPILGERVGLLRWAAVVVGFLGVVIALRPSGAALSPGALIALFGALMYALALTVTRKLRGTHWSTLVGLQFAGAGVVGALTSPFAWTPPGLVDMALMFLLGIVAMFCFICITRAIAMAPASVLAPLQYASIIWAMLLGWLIWRDVPSINVVLGAGVIVGSGFLVLYGERRAGATADQVPEPIP